MSTDHKLRQVGLEGRHLDWSLHGQGYTGNERFKSASELIAMMPYVEFADSVLIAIGLLMKICQ